MVRRDVDAQSRGRGVGCVLGVADGGKVLEVRLAAVLFFAGAGAAACGERQLRSSGRCRSLMPGCCILPRWTRAVWGSSKYGGKVGHDSRLGTPSWRADWRHGTGFGAGWCRRTSGTDLVSSLFESRGGCAARKIYFSYPTFPWSHLSQMMVRDEYGFIHRAWSGAKPMLTMLLCEEWGESYEKRAQFSLEPVVEIVARQFVRPTERVVIDGTRVLSGLPLPGRLVFGRLFQLEHSAGRALYIGAA